MTYYQCPECGQLLGAITGAYAPTCWHKHKSRLMVKVASPDRKRRQRKAVVA